MTIPFTDSDILGKYNGDSLASIRETSLANFYSAERRAGASPLVANERMMEFAKRLDQLEYDRDLEILRQVLERQS